MNVPPPLQPGDWVALLAVGSPLEPDNLPLVARAITLLEGWGLRVLDLSKPDAPHPYLAGTDTHRARALQQAWTDPTVKALLFTRGGYGSSRLLRHLDDQTLRLHRKRIVGYSDVTTLLLYFQKLTGSVVYHGPNLAAPRMFDSPAALESQHSLHDALFGENTASSHALYPIKPGEAEGELIGGNLTLLSCSLGTPHEPDTTGRILFIEDVNKPLRYIDRLLTHLRNAGKLDALNGLVFADMSGCDGQAGELWDIVADIFSDAPFPVYYGLPSGHGALCRTLPLGMGARLQSDKLHLLPGE